MTDTTKTEFKGTHDNYSIIARFNHWLITIAIIVMLAFGSYLATFVESGPAKGELIGIHKAFGVLVLLFALWRVAFRLILGFKEDAVPMASWQETFARTVHWVLMVAILVMPLSGITGSYFAGRATDVFGFFTIPAGPEVEFLSGIGGAVHGVTAWVLVIALLLHILAALKHHLIDRDTTLLRMLGKA